MGGDQSSVCFVGDRLWVDRSAPQTFEAEVIIDSRVGWSPSDIIETLTDQTPQFQRLLFDETSETCDALKTNLLPLDESQRLSEQHFF